LLLLLLLLLLLCLLQFLFLSFHSPLAEISPSEWAQVG